MNDNLDGSTMQPILRKSYIARVYLDIERREPLLHNEMIRHSVIVDQGCYR